MARTLQALRHSEASRPVPVAPLEAAPEPLVVLGSPIEVDEEEIPFIEVGGKNTPMEASASVLACSPRPTPKLQIHRPERAELAQAALPAEPKPIESTPIEAVVVSESKPVESTVDQESLPEHVVDDESAIEAPATIIQFRPLANETPALAPPEERIAPELLAFHQPDHVVSRQYEQVAAALNKQAVPGRSRVLFFTAASPQTDTSNTVLNLAVVEARKKSSRLIVVDAQFRHARTTARLGLTGQPGLRDVLGGISSLQKALVPTGIESLIALAAGRELPAPCVIAGDSMLSIVRHLKSRFDCVMIDAPAWDGRPDVTALGAACDAIYVVMDKAEADTEKARELLQLIPVQGGSLKGCILT